MRATNPLTYIQNQLLCFRAVTAAFIAALIAGCGVQTELASTEIASPTMLLVSLDDGSIISQEIAVDADVCMKGNSGPQTMCLKRGEPLYDRAGEVIIGYQMQREDIELIPK